MRLLESMPRSQTVKPPKLDLRKEHKQLYSPSSKHVSVVEVPEFQFTRLDGVIEAGIGPSQSDAFRDAMAAMYGVGYGLKFMSKLRKHDPIDYTVMPMEGLWSTESGGEFYFDWRESSLYTLLMVQPDHITVEMFEAAVGDMAVKQPNPLLDEIKFERWEEGRSIQIMHIGPYSEEPGTLAKMDTFAEENGYQFHGRHHEIYIGNPTRAKPENLKTVLRHPSTVQD
ncbi:MAG: hypothetical protein DWQ40_10925 [Actinobacteria bacterium]|nr:MAG: hypothetical protein DWQ40_10925 [Actinomycetota bacterium]